MKELFTALSRAQAQIRGALKDSSNPHFKSRYADLESVWDAARKPLTDHGLSVIQEPGFEAPNLVTLTTILCHESGECRESKSGVTLAKVDAQTVGSAITYLRRYALAAVVGIAPSDDDGNAASAKADPKPAAPPQDDAKAAYKAIKAEVEAAVAAKDGKLLGALRTKLLETPGIPSEPREALRKTINDCLDVLVREKNS